MRDEGWQLEEEKGMLMALRDGDCERSPAERTQKRPFLSARQEIKDEMPRSGLSAISR